MILQTVKYPEREPELIAEFEAAPVPLDDLISYSRALLQKSIGDLLLNGQVSYQLELNKLDIDSETDIFFCYGQDGRCVGRIVFDYGLNEPGDNLYMISRVYREQ